MNINEPNSLGLSYLGIMPCTCQCWSGPKATKTSTMASQARANAVPYLLNSANMATGSSRTCLQCKLKMDQEQQLRQQQQLTQHINCSHQHHNHLQQQLPAQCQCQSVNLINRSINVPNLMTFPVPPPSLPSSVPTFLPTTTQTSSSATMAANNQMYFVPFNMPSMMTGTTPTITTNQMPTTTNSSCPHHSAMQLPAIKTFPKKPLSSNVTPSVPTLKPISAAASEDSSRQEAINSNNNENDCNENSENEVIMAFNDDEEVDESMPNNNVKSKYINHPLKKKKSLTKKPFSSNNWASLAPL